MTAWGEPRRPAERGADPNLCQNDGVSPLIKAAMAPGDAGLEVGRLLLDNRAAIEHQNKNGETALHFACLCSNVEVAKLLLERGANQHIDTKNYGDAKGFAKRAVRKEELLALLARHA